MTITELRKHMKQLIATFSISKESDIIITEGNQRFKIKKVQGFAHNGIAHINIEIVKAGDK